jgi:hypothetical protein
MKTLLLALLVSSQCYAEKIVGDTLMNGCRYPIYYSKKIGRYVYIRYEKKPNTTYRMILGDSIRIEQVRTFKNFL